ncbi:adenosylmethionine--8-amino-7-oxononanoate transaminase [Planctomicrobium sp. SH661]|uniref:adenosylmethionine--8-amino-7-oxononanoate transaminase n=1 Tax=Planctomicrobium sp. SH661 TaxID=3448124 RepID=UPI003F5BB397
MKPNPTAPRQRPTLEQLRRWDGDHVWHPFTPMQAYRDEHAPIIESGSGFELIDVEGRRYLDGISSLWCNVHGHCVPEIDEAIRDQLGKISHTTLLGMSSPPAIELAVRLVERAPLGLNHVFYSDSGSTAVEVALKMAFQFHHQKDKPSQQRNLFATVGGAYHGDTIGSVSVGNIELFHRVYGALLFQSLAVPSPVTLSRPAGQSAEDYLQFCFAEVERIVSTFADQLAAFIIEPLVQGAAGILVHPPGYLKHVREVTRRYGVPLIADEVAVGFGRTGTLFACEQEQVSPDFLCLAKGLTGGYLPLAATLTTDEISQAFLGDPAAGRTFFHGHTFTGNALACAAGLASLDLIEQNDVLENVARNEKLLASRLATLKDHPHVAEIRQKGIMVGIELVQNRDPLTSFPSRRRTGHLVTLEARKRGVILRPLGDIVVLMPAPAMSAEMVNRLCDVAFESIDAALRQA